MAIFHFNLQALLAARTRAEDVAKRGVGKLEAARRKLEDALRTRQGRLGASKGAVRAGLVGSVNASELRMQANLSLSVMRDAQRTVLELAGIHRQLEQARDVLKKASQARRAIELVREKRFAAWRLDEKRREQRVMDELAMQRARGARKGILL
jgi:flagellar export protein FliJ